MDISPTRFSFGASDSGYSAYDSIIEDLDKEIQGALEWAEEDGSSLGYLAAHLHALVTLGEGSGGYATTKLDIEDLELRTTAAFRNHMADYPNTSPEQVADKSAFLESLFRRLRGLA